MNEEKNNNTDVLNYRLGSIEKEIKELKELLITVPLLTNKLDNIEKNLEDKTAAIEKRIEDKILVIEKRMDNIEVNQDLLTKELTKQKEEVSNLKAAPDKKAASKMNYIADYIFKAIVGIAIAWLIMSVGLGGVQ